MQLTTDNQQLTKEIIEMGLLAIKVILYGMESV